MPRLDDHSAHHFMAHALTSDSANLAWYANERFNVGLRLVALDAINEIIRQIKLKKAHKRTKQEDLPISEVINESHASTGLNMFEYCLTAGLHDMAAELIQHGASSKHLFKFQQNLSRHLANSSSPSNIFADITTIINCCVEIKNHPDQLMTHDAKLAARLFASANDLWQNTSTKTLVLIGLGCIVLAPVVHPLLHVHGLGTAVLVSAGFVPAAISGVAAKKKHSRHHNQTTQHDVNTQNLDGLLQTLSRKCQTTKEQLEAIQSKHYPAVVAERKQCEAHTESRAPNLLHLFEAKNDAAAADAGIPGRQPRVSPVRHIKY